MPSGKSRSNLSTNKTLNPSSLSSSTPSTQRSNKKKAAKSSPVNGFDLDGVGEEEEESSGSTSSGKEGERSTTMNEEEEGDHMRRRDGKMMNGLGKEGGLLSMGTKDDRKPNDDLRGEDGSTRRNELPGARHEGNKADADEQEEGGYVSDIMPAHAEGLPRILEEVDDKIGVDWGTRGKNADGKLHVGEGFTGRERRTTGRIAKPLVIPKPEPYSLAPHLAKLSRLGSYTYSALASVTGMNGSGSSSDHRSGSTILSSGQRQESYLSPGEVGDGDADKEARMSSVRTNGEVPIPTTSILTNGNGNGNGAENDQKTGRSATDKKGRRNLASRSRFGKMDFGDGKFRQCLLLVNPNPQIAIQIWETDPSPAQTSLLPHLSHQQQSEAFAQGSFATGGSTMFSSLLMEKAPREVFCFPAAGDFKHRMGKETGLDSKGLKGKVIDAMVMESGMLVVVSIVKSKDNSDGHIFASLLDPRTGIVTRERDVGIGENAEVQVSSRAIALAIASETPSIHILSPSDLSNIIKPITSSLALSNTKGLPIMSLSGRLIAFASRKSRYRPDSPIPAHAIGHGAIVTKQSIRDAQKAVNRRDKGFPSGKGQMWNGGLNSGSRSVQKPSPQSAIWDVASGVSGEVAKGVWGGLRTLSNVAMSTAGRTSVMSKSAPVQSFLGRSDRPTPQDEAGPQSAGANRELPSPRKLSSKGGRYVEILDLGRPGLIQGEEKEGSLIASFSIPRPSLSHEYVTGVCVPSGTIDSIECMAFNTQGTQLAIFPQDGRIGTVVELRPKASALHMRPGRDSGEVWLLYYLLRGFTPSSVTSLQWSERDDMVAAATYETIHVFTVCSGGGKPNIQQYLANPTRNGSSIHPLSTKTAASFRVRPRRADSRSPRGQQEGQSSGEEHESDPVRGMRDHRSPLSFVLERLPCVQQGLGVFSALSDGPSGTLVATFDSDSRILSKFDCALSASITKSAKDADCSPSRTEAMTRPNNVVDLAMDSLKWRSSIKGSARVFEKWSLSGSPPVNAENLALIRRPFSKSECAPRQVDCFAAIELHSSAPVPPLVPTTIYRRKNVGFVDLTTMPTGRTKSLAGTCLSFREYSQEGLSINLPTRADLSGAIGSVLVPGSASPMLPALPNGSSRGGWMRDHSGVLTAAKDIVRLGKSLDTHPMGLASSYGDNLALDEETGFMYEAASPVGSPPTDVQEEEWADDLIIGQMDGIAGR